MKNSRLALLAAGLSSFASAIVARGGAAGYSPVNPERFVPYTTCNIGRDILKRSRHPARYVGTPKDGSREQKRFARNLAAGRYSFFDHDANRRRLALDKLNCELDQPVPELVITGEPLPELVISDFEEDGVTHTTDLGPVKIADEVPHPVEVDHDTMRVHETPEGLKEGDVEALKLFVTEGTLRAGVRRDRLRDAGLIEYRRHGGATTNDRSWHVTPAGQALFDRRRG